MKKSPGAVDPHPGLFLPEHLGGLKKGQQPHPQLLLLPHPQPLLFHPPQQNRRIRTSQQSELQPLLLFPHPHPPLQSRSNTMMIQQESLPYPQLLLQPHPLFPQRHIRQMIQRIQLQELSPKRLVPLPHPQLLLQPHPSLPHPQFVAARSLI